MLSASSSQHQAQLLLPHLLSLEHNLVPPSWLKIFTSHHDNVSVPLDLWLNQLRERRQMLGTWYTIKHCDVMKLHLLQNPLSLFHVLKEAVAMKLQTPLENVNIECRILDLPHNPIERSAFFTKISTQNSSCTVNTYTVVASQVMLMNAIWAKDKYALEFMHPATSSRRSQVTFPPPLSHLPARRAHCLSPRRCTLASSQRLRTQRIWMTSNVRSMSSLTSQQEHRSLPSLLLSPLESKRKCLASISPSQLHAIRMNGPREM
jgi:hypothetical protein